jgi:hypothetical protein
MPRERGTRDRSRGVGAAVLSTLRDPVRVILILAGTFDWISGNPVHSLLLFGAAGALVWDATRSPTAVPGNIAASPPSATGDIAATGEVGAIGTRAWTAVFVCVALLYAVLVGGFARYSWPATAFVAILGAVAVALAWRGPLRSLLEPEPLEPLGILTWSTVFVSLGIWELVQLLLQPSLTTDSYAHPTISVTMDPILAHHPGRTIAMFVWLVAGWFLVQR